MKLTVAIAAGLVAAGATAAVAQDNWQDYLDQVRIKQAIADTLTPDQLQARRERLARWLAEQAANPVVRAPNDDCAAATPEISALPFNTSGTTVGLADNYDLPADTTAPTCTAAVTCTGAGPAGSLPQGAIYTGTGTAPDIGFSIETDANCTLSISMDPTGAEDLSLVTYLGTCSSSLADCACVDDTGAGGVAESITLDAVAGEQYFVVVDGYSTGGTPPGPSGAFDLSITGAGCSLVPVELQSFEIN